ncbi:TetR family transcriptional regulator [Brevibacterium atlanticum]|uniref:TetR family transcriptional regulator n=1 Tax=Brevibacterium atlanticum TaxID=2697563 RepID=UPI0014200231
MDLSRSGGHILETASALCTEGADAIGVDRIVAESGVPKPTLSAQFSSQARLIAEVLRPRLLPHTRRPPHLPQRPPEHRQPLQLLPGRLDERITRRRTHSPHGVHRPAGEDRAAYPPRGARVR